MNEEDLKHAIRGTIHNDLAMPLGIHDPDLAPLLDQSLVRVIVRDLLPFAEQLGTHDIDRIYDTHVNMTGGRNVVVHHSPDQAAEHLSDWLSWALRSNAPWLARTDEAGNVRKLMKFGSIPAMVAEADKDIAKMAQRSVAVVDAPGTEPVMDLDRGFRIVRLLTPEALKAESGMMQHCVGLGGYDARVVDGTTVIYSLRDNRGRSHATMNVSAKDNSVVELRGKQNRTPVTQYLRTMLPFFDRMDFSWGHRTASYLGILAAEDGTHHLVSEFPPHLAVRDLDMSASFGRPGETIDLATLPRFSRHVDLGARTVGPFPPGMRFPGDLLLQNANIHALPEDLSVAGNLDLTAVKRGGTALGSIPLDALPRRLEVDGTLILAYLTRRLSIPADLKVRNIRASIAEVVFPDGFRMEGDLDLSRTRSDLGSPGTSGHVLGRNMTIKGNLNLANSGMDELPDGLTVYGDLDISSTNIFALPDDLDLRGSLIATGSRLGTLGNLKTLRGNAHLSKTYIRNLPEGFRVTGSLDISGSAVSTLPSGLRVGKDLAIACTAVTSLPKGLKVPGKLDIRDTPIIRLPPGLYAGTLVLSSIEPPPDRGHDPWRDGPAISARRPVSTWCPMLVGAARSAKVGAVSIGDKSYPYGEIFVAGFLGRKVREPALSTHP